MQQLDVFACLIIPKQVLRITAGLLTCRSSSCSAVVIRRSHSCSPAVFTVFTVVFRLLCPTIEEGIPCQATPHHHHHVIRRD
jgi:hypothetical protein